MIRALGFDNFYHVALRSRDDAHVLQCVAVCCSVLQCVALRSRDDAHVLQCVAVCCSVLQVCCTTI